EVPAVEVGPSVELHFGEHVAPEGFAWLVPVMRDGHPRLKIGLMARGDADAHLTRFVQREDVAGRLAAAPSAAMRRLRPPGPAPRTYAARVLAVGAAAGPTKPTAAGGSLCISRPRAP